MTLYYKAPTKYYKYVYSPYTLPKMTSQTAPEGNVGTNFVFGTYSKDLYSLFWNTTGWYIDISANTSANRYINYKFKNPLPPGTYTLSCKMKTQNNVTSTGYHWDIICDNGSGGNEYITIGNPGTPPKTNENTWPAGSSYSWTFTSTKRIKFIELKINNPSVSSSSYICLSIDNLNLTCEGGLKIQTGTVESTPADYDYSVPNLLKIRDYDTTGIYYCIGKTNCPIKLSNNINISLSNGTATLKKGSKVYIPAGFYNNTGFWPNMPVHNGVASFYNDNFEWGVINKQYTIGTNDFEIVGKIKLRSAPTKEYADIYAKGYILALSVKNDLSIYCNYGNGVDTWGNEITSSANLLQLNKTYWIKSERKNGVISLSYSQDGINYTVVGTRNSTQSIPLRDLIWIGKDMERGNIFLPGDVFLDGCYIKIGGEYWWKGSDGYGAKFEEYVLPEDNSMGTVGSVTNNGDILYLDWNKNLQPYGHSFVYSSVKAPTSTYAFWYDLSHNIIRYTSDAGSTWYSGHSFPLCLMNRTNGTVTAITQLFNGFGYIGSVMFALPNTNGLIANGFKPDKTYNTISYTENSVRVNDYGPEGYTGDVTYAIGPGYFGNTGVGYEVSSDGYLIDKYNNSKITAYAYATGSRTSGKINNLSLKTINPAATLKPIGFVWQNGKLLYKGRHYSAWSMPSDPASKGYTLQGNPTGNLAALFDKSSSTTRWGQGVSNNKKWFGVIFPFPVIIDAITVKQGFAGSHNDSRTYNVRFRAESTGADGSGAAIYISNQTTLNWDVDSSTNIPITSKPICRRVYCDCNMQQYGTLNEVYISGRRVL